MKTAIYEAKRTRVTMMTMTEKNGRKIEYTSRKLVEEKERKTHSTHTHTHQRNPNSYWPRDRVYVVQ